MLFHQLFLAAAASALLIVPHVAPDVPDPASASLPEAAAAPFQPQKLLLDQSLELPCRQCRGRNANLRLDFSVADGSKLLLNGFELYPEADPWSADLSTTVVADTGRESKQRLGYSLLTVPLAFDEDQQIELIDLVFRVIEVGPRAVDAVPIVKLGLIRAHSGEILIGNIQLIDPAREQCDSLWCVVKATLHDALRGILRASRCGGGARNGQGHGHHDPHPHAYAHGHGNGNGNDDGHAHDHSHEHAHDRVHGHPGPQSDGSGRHHHQHHAESYYSAKAHARARLLRSIISHVILPVVVGVTAGVTLAFVGIFICGILYRLVTAFRRRCPRAHAAGCPRARSPLRRDPAVAETEKERLLEDEESHEAGPPAYHDAVQE